MQHGLAPPPTGLSLGGSLFNPASAAATGRHSYAPRNCTDDQFVAMLNAYRGSGGLARQENLLALFSRRCGLDADTLADWIAEREVIGFEWQSRTWLPMFQFNLMDMTRPPALGPVLAELIAVYEPWELANWFVQPNRSISRVAGGACGPLHGQGLSPSPRLGTISKNPMSCANAIFRLKERSQSAASGGIMASPSPGTFFADGVERWSN